MDRSLSVRSQTIPPNMILPGVIIVVGYMYVHLSHTLPFMGYERTLQTNIGSLSFLVLMAILFFSSIFGFGSVSLTNSMSLIVIGLLELLLGLSVLYFIDGSLTEILVISPESGIIISLLIAALLAILLGMISNSRLKNRPVYTMLAGISFIIVGFGKLVVHTYIIITKQTSFYNGIIFTIISLGGVLIVLFGVSIVIRGEKYDTLL